MFEAVVFSGYYAA